MKNVKDVQPINIMEKFSLFEKLWTPHIIGELNGQYVKLCKLKDDFVWHKHDHEDELFLVFKGCLLYTSPSPRDQRGSRMPSSA